MKLLNYQIKNAVYGGDWDTAFKIMLDYGNLDQRDLPRCFYTDPKYIYEIIIVCSKKIIHWDEDSGMYELEELEPSDAFSVDSEIMIWAPSSAGELG